MSQAADNLNFHEDLRSHQQTKIPSDRVFGFTLAAVLATIGALHLFISFGWFSFAFLVLCAVTFGATLIKPEWIGAVKNVFLKIAPKISAVVTPVLMGFIFIVCFIPGAYVLRLMHKDLIEKRPDPYRLTYWEKRGDSGLPYPMKYQF